MPATKQELIAEFIGRDDAFWGIGHDKSQDCDTFTRSGYSATCCTGYAVAILHKLGPERVTVFGFNQRNEQSEIARDVYGHDFAVVDTIFIVDPWVNSFFTKGERGVYDMSDPSDDTDVARLYGDCTLWLSAVPDGEQIKFPPAAF